MNNFKINFFITIWCFFYFSTMVVGQQLITPNYLFNSDPTLHEINGKFYLFTTHDQTSVQFQGPEDYWHSMMDYHAYSTIDFKNWVDHGSILSIHDLNWSKDFSVWDGDAGIAANGKFYAYVPVRDGVFKIAVMVADRPEGPYTDIFGRAFIDDNVLAKNGINYKTKGICQSPTVVWDNDTPYLLFGQFHVFMVKLKPNMVELDGPVKELDVPLKAGRATEYIEGPMINKINNKYYFTYMTYKDYEGKNPNFSEKDPKGPYIQYCVSDNLLGPYKNPRHWIYPVDTGACNNQHGLGFYKDKWYVAYHVPYQQKQHRQVAITYVKFNKKGDLLPIYPAGDKGVIPLDSIRLTLDAFAYKRQAEEFYERKDAVEERGLRQDFHFKMKNDGYLLFKNMDFGTGAKSVKVSVSCENSKIRAARIEFRLDSLNGEKIAECTVNFTYWITYYQVRTSTVTNASGIHNVYLVAKGEGGDAENRLFNISWFTFSKD